MPRWTQLHSQGRSSQLCGAMCLGRSCVLCTVCFLITGTDIDSFCEQRVWSTWLAPLSVCIIAWARRVSFKCILQKIEISYQVHQTLGCMKYIYVILGTWSWSVLLLVFAQASTATTPSFLVWWRTRTGGWSIAGIAGIAWSSLEAQGTWRALLYCVMQHSHVHNKRVKNLCLPINWVWNKAQAPQTVHSWSIPPIHTLVSSLKQTILTVLDPYQFI